MRYPAVGGEGGGLDGAEAAVTFGVFVEGVEELGFTEVGPERGD
jgi:hypothetical protein